MDNFNGQNLEQNNAQAPNEQQSTAPEMPSEQQNQQVPPYPFNMTPTSFVNDGNNYAVASFVLGILSTLFCVISLSILGILFLASLVMGIIGIVLGAKSRKMSKIVFGKPSGLATAGLILSIIGLCLSTVVVTCATVIIGCVLVALS